MRFWRFEATRRRKHPTTQTADVTWSPEICYRLFDIGKSSIAVAYLMSMTLR